jgi:hypothetical protein
MLIGRKKGPAMLSSKRTAASHDNNRTKRDLRYTKRDLRYTKRDLRYTKRGLRCTLIAHLHLIPKEDEEKEEEEKEEEVKEDEVKVVGSCPASQLFPRPGQLVSA